MSPLFLDPRPDDLFNRPDQEGPELIGPLVAAILGRLQLLDEGPEPDAEARVEPAAAVELPLERPAGELVVVVRPEDGPLVSHDVSP